MPPRMRSALELRSYECFPVHYPAKMGEMARSYEEGYSSRGVARSAPSLP